MRLYWAFSILAFLVLITAAAVAKSKQEVGENLVARAIEVSDIRAKGALAFRLKGNLRVLGVNSSSDQGTYSEIWVSREQWRRQTELGNFSRVEVGGQE